MADDTNCPLCGLRKEDGVKMWNAGEQYLLRIICPVCGEYECDFGNMATSTRWTQEFKCALSCATRQSFEAGLPIRLDGRNAEQYAAQHAHTRVSDNEMALLALIAKKSGGRPSSKKATLSVTREFNLIDCFTSEEFRWHLKSVLEQKLILPPSNLIASNIEVQLTVEGWKQVQPLSKPGGIPGRCFVAMSFDKSMNEVFEFGIVRAVMDCGLPKPIRIDQKEHNNQITDEMMAEIRDAEFVVADFTGHRNGVYYEAGFARGLGRPVIYCCKDKDLSDVHFDTRIINHISWSDAADLRTKLANRIKATIIPRT